MCCVSVHSLLCYGLFMHRLLDGVFLTLLPEPLAILGLQGGCQFVSGIPGSLFDATCSTCTLHAIGCNGIGSKPTILSHPLLSVCVQSDRVYFCCLSVCISLPVRLYFCLCSHSFSSSLSFSLSLSPSLFLYARSLFWGVHFHL